MSQQNEENCMGERYSLPLFPAEHRWLAKQLSAKREQLTWQLRRLESQISEFRSLNPATAGQDLAFIGTTLSKIHDLTADHGDLLCRGSLATPQALWQYGEEPL